MKHILNGLILCLSLLGLAACGSAGRPANELLPTMNNYTKLDFSEFTNLGQLLADLGLADIIRANRTLSAQIDVADRLLACAKKNDGLAMKVYSDPVYPTSVGVAVAVNVQRLFDLDSLFSCALTDQGLLSAGPEFRPCVNAWNYTEANTNYSFFYLGTTAEICSAMCSGMPNCTAP